MTGTSVSTHYLHGNATTSLVNPIRNSFTYSFNYHLNTEGRTQRTGTYGARFCRFSFNVLEDHGAWLGADGEDRWWTGSGNVNWQFKDFELSIGTDTYTGNSYNGASTPEDLGDFEPGGKTRTAGRRGLLFYWANQLHLDEFMMKKPGYNQSLNNAQTFLQVKTAYGIGQRITSFGPSNFWSQNSIHDYLNPNFHHFKPSTSKNIIQITGNLYLDFMQQTFNIFGK